MNLSRKLVLIRLIVSLAVLAYLSYASYDLFYTKGKHYEFLVLMAFFTLFMVWSGLSQFKFHRIAPAPTVLQKDEQTYLFLRLVYFLVIFMALLDFVYLGASRVKSLEPYSFYAGVAVFLVACVIRWWAYSSIGSYFSPRISLYKGHQLITTGAYRQIRHPLYLGMLLELFSISLMFSSLVGVFLTIILAIPAIVYRIRLEEAMMADAFPGEYAQYCSSSKKLIPFIY